MVWFLMWFLALKTEADSLSQAVFVADSLPTAAFLEVNDATVDLVSGATQSAYFSGTLTDANGCYDVIDSRLWQIKAYRTGLGDGFACIPDGNNCYEVDPAALILSGCSANGDVTLDYTGKVDLQYFADATDVGSNFPDDTWTVEMHYAHPSLAYPIAAVDAFEVASLIAVQHNITDIGYGYVPAGSDSAVQTVTFSSTGNRSVDIVQAVSGDFVCSGAQSENIPLAQLKYHLSQPLFTWDDPSAKTVLVHDTIDLNLLPQQVDEQVNMKSVYYRLRVPPNVYSGFCSNTLSLTAVADGS